MQPIKSILVPVDFSPIAVNAYHYALQLADQLRASVDLLYSIPPASVIPDQAPFAISFVEDLQEEAKAGIRQLLEAGLDAFSGKLVYPPQVRAFVKVGDLRHTINELVGDENHDLVLLGTHGQQDALDKFLGTNSTFLLKKAPAPVLVVPDGCAFRPLKLICFATDLNHAENFQPATLLRTLQAEQADLHFLHVLPEDAVEKDYDLGQLRQAFGESASDANTTLAMVRNQDVIAGIFAYANTHQCDLVVMHRPEHGWLADLLRTSNTRAAALQTDLPLLIFRSEDFA